MIHLLRASFRTVNAKRWIVGILAASMVATGLMAQRVKDWQSPLDDLVTTMPETFIPSRGMNVTAFRSSLSEPKAETAALLAGYDGFLSKEGGSWWMQVDELTGRPALVEGSGVPWIPGRGNGLTAETAGLMTVPSKPNDVPLAVMAEKALALVRSFPGLFQVEPGELVLNERASGPVLDYLYFVDFDWTYHGIPVEHAHVVFRVNNGNLVQFGEERVSSTIGELDPIPSLTPETAWQILWSYAGGRGPGDRVVDEGHLLVVPVSTDRARSGVSIAPGSGLSYRLVYVLSFHRPGVMGTWEGRVDAHTGELLSFRDANKYGHVQGGVYKKDANPTHTEVSMPFPYADYGSGQYADAAGNFAGTTGTSSLNGKYVKISDLCGAPSLSADGSGLIDFGSSTGTDCDVANGNSTHAARTQYWNVTQIKIKALTYLPNNSWLKGKITDNVNLNQTCNAYWDGSQVNFFKSGGGCNNTGELPGVSMHEWGHGLDSNDGNGSSPDNGSGENYGDTTALLQTHASCLGGGFLSGNCSGYGNPCLDCTGVRDVDWAKHAGNVPATLTFANTNCPADPSYAGPCGNEGHCESYVPSEANWDLATRDLVTWGLDTTSAWQLLDKFWYASRSTATKAYECSVDASCSTGNLNTVFRVVDDCDGNLSNGTPHASAIWAAFHRHEIGCSTAVNTDSDCGCPNLSAPLLDAASGDNQVFLTWTPVSGASTYTIYRNATSCTAGFTKIAGTSDTTFTDTLAVNGVTYYYRVEADGQNGCPSSAMSGCVERTPIACTAPGEPTLDSVAANGDNRIDLSWTGGNPAGSSYNVYRATGSCPQGSYTLLASGVSATSYSDTTVSGGLTYAYTVRAAGTEPGCESLRSNCLAATAQGACTLLPTFGGLTSVTAPAQTTCSLVLGWSAGTANCAGPITYSVYRDTSPGFTPGPGNRTAFGLTDTSYTDESGIAPGTKYYYVVRAVDESNGLDDGNSVEKWGEPVGVSTVIFSDDFEGADKGWVSAKGSPAAATGDFLVGDPVGTVGNYGQPCQPEDDHTAGPGVNCLYTAENPIGEAGTNDVDDGEVMVTSPSFDCSGFPAASLDLWRWFENEDDDDAGDYYVMEVSNDGGSSWVQLEEIPGSVTTTDAWTHVTFPLQDFVTLTSNMKVRVRVADGTAAGDLIEAAIDDVRVTGFEACTPGNTCVLNCSASAAPSSGAAPLPVAFSGTATANQYCEGNASYDWDFGDGSAHSSQQNPTHTYTALGVFTWTLTVTLDSETCVKTGTVSVTSAGGVSCLAIVSPRPCGNPGEAIFSGAATGVSGGAIYDWDFGDGTAHSSAQSPSHTYAAGGSYTWTLMVTDGQNGCIESGVLSICELSCTATVPATSQPGSAVSFSSAVQTTGCTGVAAYLWDFGDGSTSTEANPSHTYASTGSYSWSLTVSDGFESCVKKGSILVVNPPVISSMVKKGGPFRIIVNGSNLQDGIRVYINGTEFTGVTWKSTAKIKLSGSTLKTEVPKGVNTTFRFVNPDGGEATTTWSYLTGGAPPLTPGEGRAVAGAFGGGSTVLCSPTCLAMALPNFCNSPRTVVFLATAGGCTGTATYDWDFGDGTAHSTQQNPTHTYASGGAYTWTVTASLNGASCSKSGILNICELTCDATVPTKGLPGASIAFDSTVTATGCTGLTSILWDFGDGNTSTEADPSHAYTSGGSYTWTLTVSADGATCTKSGTIAVVNPPVISSMVKKGGPFRIIVNGSNLQSGIRVFINGTEFTGVTWKKTTKIKLSGGTLKTEVPKGVETTFRFVNPDGGEVTTTWSY